MLTLNGNPVESGIFPNQETYVRTDLLDFSHKINCVECSFESNNDLINLFFLKKHLDNMGCKSRLVLLNFPYARMDRQNDSYAFSLKYFCEFINNMNFKTIKIMEPHSDVCPALLNNCEIYNYIVDNISKVFEKICFGDNDFLFFPDAGAQKRYGKMNVNCNVAIGNKLRDFKTGNIVSYKIDYDKEKINPKEGKKKFLIIDDLCSRGGTFIEASDRIFDEFGSEDIYLFVAHCEPNIFTGTLLTNSHIRRVFTSSSIIRPNHEKITII